MALSSKSTPPISTSNIFDASLTTAQRRLGLTYDANKLLTNSLGQCVEGLSTAQIKLGLYVDELGRVRTLTKQTGRKSASKKCGESTETPSDDDTECGAT